MVENHAERLILEAFVDRVSDIHFIPRKEDCLIKYRFGNDLMIKETISKAHSTKLISHFKFLASMDIGEKRRPQTGSLMLSIHEKLINLRLSTLPTPFEESLVIRLLPQEDPFPTTELSLFPEAIKTLTSLMKNKHGLMIFTGPTGSGKTTTLYSLLHAAHQTLHRNVITLEDPIEKHTDYLLQVQVNEKAGITYASGLKAILRHDPDIIMVGEIRDEETAQIAIRAALTGHLVLSTMHTKDTKGAIYRLKEFNINIQEMEQSLLAIAAQRLFDLSCPFCGENCTPTCRKIRKAKRMSVYEILHGRSLEGVIEEARGNPSTYSYQTFSRLIKKGIALGFLPASSLEGWKRDQQNN